MHCYKNKAITKNNGEQPCETIDPALSVSATYYNKTINLESRSDGCYVFNKGGNLTQKGNAASANIAATVSDSFHANETVYLQVIIQGADEPYFRFMEQSRYLHAPGSYVIVLNKVFMERLEYPYPSQCSKDGNGTDNLMDMRYTQINCEESCLLRIMFKECGALPDTMSQYLTKEMNMTQTNLTEAERRKRLHTVIKQGLILPPKECNCPYACMDTQFNPLVQKLGSLERRWEITLAYQSLTVTSVTEEPLTTYSDVLSSFGGFMGLLLGASVLSIGEIILVVILVPVRALYNIGKRNS